MRHLRRSAFLRLVVLPFTLTLFLAACHKWVALEPPYSPAIEAAGAIEQMRVNVDDEARCTNCDFRSFDAELFQPFPRGVLLESPVLRNDTLYSLIHKSFTTDTVRIPLERLESVEVLENSAKPLLWGAGLLVGVGLMFLLMKKVTDDLECVGVFRAPDHCFD